MNNLSACRELDQIALVPKEFCLPGWEGYDPLLETAARRQSEDDQPMLPNLKQKQKKKSDQKHKETSRACERREVSLRMFWASKVSGASARRTSTIWTDEAGANRAKANKGERMKMRLFDWNQRLTLASPMQSSVHLFSWISCKWFIRFQFFNHSCNIISSETMKEQTSEKGKKNRCQKAK